MNRKAKFEALDRLDAMLQETYADGIGINDPAKDALPRRAEVIAVTEKLLEVIFPGFDRSGTYPCTRVLLGDILRELSGQIAGAMHRLQGDDCLNCQDDCVAKCDELAMALLNKLPAIREVMKLDVEAAFNGDPAAKNYDEIILSYPGLKAIAIQRLAHELYEAKVPLIPRMMTEFAHSETGIDIHPGARIGKGVFIDHGTGVVVGETAVIGDNVRITGTTEFYQGEPELQVTSIEVIGEGTVEPTEVTAAEISDRSAEGKLVKISGTVESFADHRIAMCAAIAATQCEEPVTILGAECVEKSYPAFFEDYQNLGGNCHGIILE